MTLFKFAQLLSIVWETVGDALKNPNIRMAGTGVIPFAANAAAVVADVMPMAETARRRVHDMRCSSVVSGGKSAKLCLNASVTMKISSAPMPSVTNTANQARSHEISPVLAPSNHWSMKQSAAGTSFVRISQELRCAVDELTAKKVQEGKPTKSEHDSVDEVGQRKGEHDVCHAQQTKNNRPGLRDD